MGPIAIITLTSANWTFLLSIIAVCLTALATLTKIFGKKIREEDFKRIEKENEDMKQRHESLKTTVSEIETDLAVFKERTKNNEKSFDEMKQDNREIVQRLDYLLKQLLEYLSG